MLWLRSNKGWSGCGGVGIALLDFSPEIAPRQQTTFPVRGKVKVTNWFIGNEMTIFSQDISSNFDHVLVTRRVL